MAKSQDQEEEISLPAVMSQKPSFLAEAGERAGIEGLASVVRPSFIKIIQKNSADELLAKHGNGAMILTPDGVKIADAGGKVGIIPIFWYREWCIWAPMALKGREPMIKERTYDPKHIIAMRAQSSATWSQPHPSHANDPKFNYRYCEHLNFVVKLVGAEFEDQEPVLLSFYRTNYMVGSRFAKLILGRQSAIFAGVYELGTKIREDAQNSWKVYSVQNHPDTPWVDDPELFNNLKEMHDRFEDLFAGQKLETVYDEDAMADANVVDAGVGTGTY